MPGCKIAARENIRTANYSDMFFNIIESERKLSICWDYRNTLYNSSTINRWADVFIDILNAIQADPNAALGALPAQFGSASNLKNFSENIAAIPFGGNDSTVLQAFARCVEKIPDKPATIFEGEQLTYSDIDQGAEKTRAVLCRNGAKPGDIVAILHDRSANVIAAALGVWKAGCIYLPLDPEFPADRLRYMINDSCARFVVTDNHKHPALKDSPISCIAMEEILATSLPAQHIAEIATAPEKSAYILYTSGSTGNPKGVAISHHSMVNFLTSMAKRPGVSASDRLLALTTPSFDISVLEMFLPICVGASVVVAASDEAVDGFLLAELIKDHSVTLIQGTPATWRLILDADADVLKGVKALCGGEPMPPAIVDALLPIVGSLWNMYGPTETTVWSTCAQIKTSQKIHVGGPIDNTSIYVVDRLGAPTLRGVPGEILIGGNGVAIEYLGMPESTASKFIANPFSDGGRLYKTGDWGRIDEYGNLIVLGRRDNQVKIRGHRIELNEIEKALEAHPDIRQAACAVHRDSTGEDLLIAYAVPRNDLQPTVSEVRHFLRQRLPYYMIPQFCMIMDKIPMTNNNKVDRKKLPAPTELQTTQPNVVSPRTPEEKGVAAIWQEILDINDISVTHNFFELGGQSLKVAQMVARVRKELGFRIPPQAVVFETLEQLVERREVLKSA